MKLYYHKTDGGAEYLCTKAVEGTTEGDLHFSAVRLDGPPELLGEYPAAPDLLAALEEIAEGAGPFSQDPLEHAANTIEAMKELARAAIAKAKAKGAGQ